MAKIGDKKIQASFPTNSAVGTSTLGGRHENETHFFPVANNDVTLRKATANRAVSKLDY